MLCSRTVTFQAVINNLLSSDEKYQFHINEYEITESLEKTIKLQEDSISTEKVSYKFQHIHSLVLHFCIIYEVSGIN